MKLIRSFFAVTFVMLMSLGFVLGSTETSFAAETTASFDGEEQALLSLVNDYRRQNGLGDLSFDGALQNVASWYSQDLADNNYFSHTDLQGRDPFQRLAAFGVDRDYEGENLAAGHADAGSVLTQWKNSPAHNGVLLTPDYTKAGLSRHFNPNSEFGWYWTLNVSSN